MKKKMNQHLSLQHGKHRHVSKNTVSLHKLHNFTPEEKLEYQSKKRAAQIAADAA
jgi:hypothetical protein